ncbi:NAD-dependent succinate-semialdehyde dehydrogenase [Novosphingobium pentaromativorans]|uniref:Aldehyde dehydrogenase n=1 Tax=Novosphingobium pentaromativorans US6-1 TaxID=1088721 RepID=G6EG38_9SPHN|nr:NAD-dependent succinate-semialdehyde dehydrogenase [Novosphingobium pentaromativorans]EHJ59727.1 Aldehyde dehydrogenase [Novosphingobium pentaromativorans US6-1]
MSDSSMPEELPLTRADLRREKNYIDGRWVDSDDRIMVRNPATGRILGSIPDAGADEAELAVAAAARAFPQWSALSAAERAGKLLRWHDLILDHREDLARLITAEQGKPIGEALWEVGYAASFIRWFAEEARRVYGDIIPGHARDMRIAVTREPVGVTAAITPWNFPLAMISRKAGPALAVGCTMVVKPSELTPFSALALALLAGEAGIPNGVLNIVAGEAQPIGKVLVTHPEIAKLSFTGSTGVGKMLASVAMQSVKRLSLELGGNAPFIVFDDADLEAALDGVMASKFRNAGQTCVCANRFYVQSGIYDVFVDRLAKRIAGLQVGNGMIDGVNVGPLINDAAVTKVQSHVDDASSRGARVLLGGHAIDGAGHFFQPTLVRDLPPDARLCREETFGPLAGIVSFDTEGQAIAMANEGNAGLAAYFYTRDLSRSHRVAEALQYGMVGLNTGQISTEVAPFGGIKQSGFGREGSRYGIDEYLNMKLVCTAIEGE